MGFPAKAYVITYEEKTTCLYTEAAVIKGNKQYTVKAVWDTGATRTAISCELAELMGLSPDGSREFQAASGVVSSDVYEVDILLPNDVLLKNVAVTGLELATRSYDLLLGAGCNNAWGFCHKLPRRQSNAFI